MAGKTWTPERLARFRATMRAKKRANTTETTSVGEAMPMQGMILDIAEKFEAYKTAVERLKTHLDTLSVR